MAYLDHAATTPMLAEAVAAVVTAMSGTGNPSSLHGSGRRARRLVEEGREAVAAALGARPFEVVFTGGGTESDNLAVKGLYLARRSADPRRRRIVTSAVEHHAVLDAVAWLAEHEGAEVSLLPVDVAGRVDPQVVADELGDDVALVSLMWANNEVGTVQPVPEVADLAHRWGALMHTDAVQAAGQVPLDFAASGVDAMTVTGHKLGGPVGAGALLLGLDVACTPLLHGGGQERQVRSGTLDVAGICGLASAVTVAVSRQPATAARLAALRDDLVARVCAQVPGAALNGDPGPGRLPGNAHLAFPGCAADELLVLLDAAGVEVSTGSACSAGISRASHVLLAMGDADRASSSLRFSLGHTSTPADVDAVLAALPGAVARLRGLSAAAVR